MQSKIVIPLGLLVVAAMAAAAVSLPNGGSAPMTLRRPAAPLIGMVVDRDGFTVYRFDESSRPISQRRTDPRVDSSRDRRLLSCDGGTPRDWPPVSYQQNPTLHGVDAGLLGYVERIRGERQLTIRGCPIYRYSGDRQPGEATGNGHAGVWFAIRLAETMSTSSSCNTCLGMRLRCVR
jgi:predicted lipoprotein with Yx(FWY)xxD motif